MEAVKVQRREIEATRVAHGPKALRPKQGGRGRQMWERGSGEKVFKAVAV